MALVVSISPYSSSCRDKASCVILPSRSVLFPLVSRISDSFSVAGEVGADPSRSCDERLGRGFPRSVNYKSLVPNVKCSITLGYLLFLIILKCWYKRRKGANIFAICGRILGNFWKRIDLRGIFRLSTAFRKGFIIKIMKLSFFLGFLKSILQWRRYTLKKKNLTLCLRPSLESKCCFIIVLLNHRKLFEKNVTYRTKY